MRATEPIKTTAARNVELERLRQELLRRILLSEQRRAAQSKGGR